MEPADERALNAVSRCFLSFADFRAILSDMAFPADPFAREPSSLAHEPAEVMSAAGAPRLATHWRQQVYFDRRIRWIAAMRASAPTRVSRPKLPGAVLNSRSFGSPQEFVA
jgi:hypothetical protein